MRDAGESGIKKRFASQANGAVGIHKTLLRQIPTNRSYCKQSTEELQRYIC